MARQLIDNKRHLLKDVLSTIIKTGEYDCLSIATGYWDLSGMVDIIDDLCNFKKIRLLIGQEPIPDRLQKVFKLDPNSPEELFPDTNFSFDLEQLGEREKEEVDRLRKVSKQLAELITLDILEVKVFRKPRLHAKAYIFGDVDSESAVGIIGSSNFTRAGLTSNAELNYLEDDHRQVLFQPKNSTQDHGHLSWFNELWNDPEAIDWTGEFAQVIQKSPVGDITFGSYDVYIKTLMEVFPDELLPPEELSEDTSDVLYSFQNRNAGILLKKLESMNVAMLADSVGLGKTITAGAIIKHYREKGARRVIVITPAALQQQWRDDLGERFGLDENDFTVISMQNISMHEQLIDDMQKPWVREVDLFIIDEAHNLRSPGSARYNSILELLETSPKAPVLLLTATPINNSLIDFANQIQLGLRGSMSSVPVQYKDSNGEIRTVDFINALKNIQSDLAKAERAGEVFDWERYKGTLRSGIRQYLVRSTRQGVEKEGGLIKKNTTSSFPGTIVNQLPYEYNKEVMQYLREATHEKVKTTFEGIDPLSLNLDIAQKFTQQAVHPLDLYGSIFNHRENALALDSVSSEDLDSLFIDQKSNSLIISIFQIINFLGFVPYRPDVYRHRYYGKTRGQIRDLGLKGDEQTKIITQRTIHNILHVTWLKRIESSVYALLKSVEYYSKRLELFSKYLVKGYIVSLSDISELESEYGEDLERAFDDYDKTYQEIQKALDENRDITDMKIKGVERCLADPQEFKIDTLKNDIARDQAISEFLHSILTKVLAKRGDGKLITFAKEIEKQLRTGSYGKKVLVFSFFSDTIEYLKNNLPNLMSDIPDFENRSEFLSGNGNSKTEDVARRFAPDAKKYQLKEDEQEIDFLFATDTLSEGQNLQDAGFLVNYDLHWNPVRMIQRNGRINRLGSPYENVLVVNIKPHEDIELYLKLVRRLERKIDTIKNSVGTDQSVLGEKENPIEFIEFYSDDPNVASKTAKDIEESSQALDIFASEDEYIFDLRQFIAEHNGDDEYARVKSIPKGKWNYLPQYDFDNLGGKALTAALTRDSYLALVRIEGRGSVSEVPFNTTMFVKVQARERYRAKAMEEIEALSLIKTIPEDNAPSWDTIPDSVDRTLIARRANKMAEKHTEGNDGLRDLKPAEKHALDAVISNNTNELDFYKLAQRIKFEQDNREFKTVVRMINKEMNEQGVISATTLTRFNNLMEKLDSAMDEKQQIERISNILFYAVS